MSLQDLNTVLSILPRLAVSELLKVKDKTNASLSLSPPTTTPNKLREMPVVDYVLEGITFELRRRGLLGRDARVPYNAIPRSYNMASQDIRWWVQDNLGLLSAAEYVAVGQLLARCLAVYFEKQNQTISASLLCQNVSKIPQALEDSYPGYLKAGLLSFAYK